MITLRWQSKPGSKYRVQSKDSLTVESQWVDVEDQPIAAEGLIVPFGPIRASSQVKVFRVIEIDDRPPEIVLDFPPADSFTSS